MAAGNLRPPVLLRISSSTSIYYVSVHFLSIKVSVSSFILYDEFCKTILKLQQILNCRQLLQCFVSQTLELIKLKRCFCLRVEYFMLFLFAPSLKCVVVSNMFSWTFHRLQLFPQFTLCKYDSYHFISGQNITCFQIFRVQANMTLSLTGIKVSEGQSEFKNASELFGI